jgi:hypothetical protein
MSEIMNTAIVVKSIGRWNPRDLAFIEKLEYQCATETLASCVLLVGVMQRRDEASSGWPSDTVPRFRVTLLFDGVRDLELNGFGHSAKQIMGFDIIDVSDRGLEDVSFVVEDYENGVLHFSCRAVDILGIARI